MKQILIVIVMAAQIAQSAQDPTKLLKSIQETQRHYHIADLSSLTDGSVYLMINGGFSGAFFEFADLTENERFSITIGKSLSQGGESFKKAIRYPFTDAFHDPSIEDLRLSIRKLIAAKLPSEVDHISTTDSREIFVAEKRKGELFYWARETGGTEMEPEFFELFQKAKATEKLVEPTAPRVEPSPAVPVPGPTLPTVEVSNNETVKAMQASIRSGNIREFTYAQVTDWKAGGEEQVDGEPYQTGLVTYKDDTIFGVKTIQAKALLKNGMVVKWFWPNSGKEIK